MPWGNRPSDTVVETPQVQHRARNTGRRGVPESLQGAGNPQPRPRPLPGGRDQARGVGSGRKDQCHRRTCTASVRQPRRAGASARPRGPPPPKPGLCSQRFRHLCVASTVFFFLLFIGYNYRVTGSCKNDTERFLTPFIQFPPVAVSYITTDWYHSREADVGTQRVCAVLCHFITRSFM